MPKPTVEWIVANAINEQERGDPDALAADITPLWGRLDTASLQQQRTRLSVLSHTTS